MALQQRERKNESEQKRLQRRILATLAKLGGEAFKDDDITFEGNKLILPVNMTAKQAIKFLENKIKLEEEYTDFTRIFKYRPWDGAYCTWNALKQAFGAVSHNVQTIQTMFGPQQVPPQIITINVGPEEQMQVPWGEFGVPFLPGATITLGAAEDDELGQLFRIHVSAPRKWRAQVEGIFLLVQAELEERSLYRGKAFDGKPQPDFVDLRGVDPKKVVYSEEVMVQLEANVWSLLRYSQQQRDLEIPLKRAVLIEGPYGTGKTLAAFLTAQEAVANNWTFLYARPARDDLVQVMQTARLYQPAVVFFEDMDTVAAPEVGGDKITTMLDLFDGITAKGTEILAILTTNHPEKIHKGMVRPGRLDAVIKIAALDNPGIAQLIQATVPEQFLGDNINWEEVSKAHEGFMPAFVKEASDRAMRYAISRTRGEVENVKLSTEDFVNAASGLRPQLVLMEGAKDTFERDPLSTTMRKIMHDASERVVFDMLQKRYLEPEKVEEMVKQSKDNGTN